MAELPHRFLDSLRSALGEEKLRLAPAERWPYGLDNSRQHAPPDAVAFASNPAEVRAVVRLCYEHGVPLVARGRGTGTTGGAVPLAGGLVLSLERMNRILAVDPANRVLRAEAGVLNQAVQEEAARHGLFWPPDPSSAAFCTIGGNLALNAAGPRAVKYGTPRENTLGLKLVTGAGVEISTGFYTTKAAVGYDLTRLVIGSEGTLAVITEATLKLTPLPEARRTLLAVYRNVRAATKAVVRIMGQAATPSALEFMDARAIELIRPHVEVELPHAAGALLILEVDGPANGIEAVAGQVAQAARDEGLLALHCARSHAEARTLWETRKALSPALRRLAPNKLNEDVVVPVTRIPELIEGLERLSEESGIPIVNFGHAGNGNIHVNLLYDTQDPAQARNALPALARVFDLALALGGTLSGEHGIGLAKRDFLARALDPEALALMRAIKREFDPRGILNPGKLFASAV